MNKFWNGIAFATIASFAMGSTGCDAIKKMIGPRMDKPTVGTRVSAIASLDIKSETDKAKYLGCDLKYWNMPAGAKIKLTWHVYGDEDGDGKADDDDPINQTSGKEQDVQGNGVINAYLQSLDGDFGPGIYECKWEAVTSKKVDGGEQSAKIKVGDPKAKKSKKKKGGDDDDAPKKKKKSSDDD
jgi:hypothetical protein